MNMPLVLTNRRRRGGSASAPAFSPSTLFALAEPGIWLDPSDLTTMFSDRAGTTPVTTPGTVVGLRLDKSKGLVSGSELVVNGDFSGGVTTGWTSAGSVLPTLSVVSGRMRMVSNTTAASSAYQAITTVAGRWYKIIGQYTRVAGTSASEMTFNVRDGVSPTTGASLSFQNSTAGSTGNYSFQFLATAATSYLHLRFSNLAENGSTYDVDNISVRELAGNHALAPTDAARPTYGIEPKGGRRNLLTWSEDYSNPVWVKTAATVTANAAAAPDGTTTADALFETASTSTHQAYQSASVVVGVTYAASIYVKANGRTKGSFQCYASTSTFEGFEIDFDLVAKTITPRPNSTGTITASGIEELANGWFRIYGAGTFASKTTVFHVIRTRDDSGNMTYLGDATKGLFVWGAQLELGSTATNYQRVTTAYDITESGVATCHYVQYDGSDDSMSTSAIDFTGTDKMSVFAGVRKNVDSPTGMIAELSTDASALGAFGSFFFLAGTNAGGVYSSLSRGSAAAAAGQATFTTAGAAPDAAVLTVTHDIAGDLSTIRRNGVAGTSATADKGTGNFGNYPLFFGRRNNATLPFNGKDYGIIVVGKAASAGEISNTELWLSDKTAEVDVAKSISPNIYTRSGDTILDRANSIIERRTV